MAQFNPYGFQIFGNQQQIYGNQPYFNMQTNGYPQFYQNLSPTNNQYNPYLDMQTNPQNEYLQNENLQKFSIPFKNSKTGNGLDAENDCEEYEYEYEEEEEEEYLEAENIFNKRNDKSLENNTFKEDTQIDDNQHIGNKNASSCNGMTLSEDEKDKLTKSIVNVLSKYINKTSYLKHRKEKFNNNNFQAEDLAVNIFDPSVDSSFGFNLNTMTIPEESGEVSPPTKIRFNIDNPNYQFQNPKKFVKPTEIQEDKEFEDFLLHIRWKKLNEKLALRRKMKQDKKADVQVRFSFNENFNKLNKQEDKKEFYNFGKKNKFDNQKEISDEQDILSIEKEKEKSNKNKRYATEPNNSFFEEEEPPSEDYEKSNESKEQDEKSSEQNKLVIEEEEEDILEEIKDQNESPEQKESLSEKDNLTSENNDEKDITSDHKEENPNEQEKSNETKEQNDKSSEQNNLVVEEEEEDKSEGQKDRNESSEQQENAKEQKELTVEKDEEEEITSTKQEENKEEEKFNEQENSNENADQVEKSSEQNKSDQQEENPKEEQLVNPLEVVYLVSIKEDRNCSYDTINESIERGIPGNPCEKEINEQKLLEETDGKDDSSNNQSEVLRKDPLVVENLKLDTDAEIGGSKNFVDTLMEHTAEKLETLVKVSSGDIEQQNEESNSSSFAIHEPGNPSLRKSKTPNSSSSNLFQENENTEKDPKIKEKDSNDNDRDPNIREKRPEAKEIEKLSADEGIPVPKIDDLLHNQKPNKTDSEEEKAEKPKVVERSLKLELENENTNKDQTISEQNMSQSDSSLQGTDSKTRKLDSKPRKLTFSPQEPQYDDIQLKTRTSSPRRNRSPSPSHDESNSSISEPQRNKNPRDSPRRNRIPENSENSTTNSNSSENTNSGANDNNSSANDGGIKESSSISISDRLTNSAPSEAPKKGALIIQPDPDQVVVVPSARGKQNIALMASKSVPISSSISPIHSPIIKKKKKSEPLSPELNKLMKNAKLGKPLNNASLEELQQLLIALNEERKSYAKDHKFKEGLACNSTIGHVSKYFELAKMNKKKIDKRNSGDSDSQSELDKTKQLNELKKKLDFFLVQSKFKEAEEIQNQINELKSESEKSDSDKKKLDSESENSLSRLDSK